MRGDSLDDLAPDLDAGICGQPRSKGFGRAGVPQLDRQPGLGVARRGSGAAITTVGKAAQLGT